MQQLRLVGVAEDGENLVLADSENGRYTLPLNDELRSAVRRDRRVSAEGASSEKSAISLRPKDVQGLIRGGVPLEEVAERAGWSLEKVERYEGPIRAERDYVSGLAQNVQLPGREAVTLRERADRRLAERDVEAERVVWDSWKSDETHWTVVVRFPAGGRLREATWLFDPVSRTLRTVDDEARWLGGDEIGTAEETSPEHEKTAARKRKSAGAARHERDAAVYDVEAEGGLADAQAPHLGSAIRTQDAPDELAASMRARQASRGRGKSRSTTSRAASVPGMTPDASRPEPLDLAGTPAPPAPSHPRPEDLAAASGTKPAPKRAPLPKAKQVTTAPDDAPQESRSDSEVGKDGDAADQSTSEAQPGQESSTQEKTNETSRRRKNRRSRRSTPQAPVRSALLTHDEDELDDDLFVELPGFHEGGEEPEDSFEDEPVDSDETDEGTDSEAEGRAESAGDESPEAADEADEPDSNADEESDDKDAASSKDAKDTKDVPARASQSRRSGRPSVPSWDDIMFGGNRGPKR